MEKDVREQFPEWENYHRVWPLHLEKGSSFELVQQEAPTLPRGWWELAGLFPTDRIEFVRGFWQMTLPYAPHVDVGIGQFFSRLKDIGVFLLQPSSSQALLPYLVYQERGDGGFFSGGPPISKERLARLHEQFAEQPLPADYLAFLKIHDGLSRTNDTGLISSDQLLNSYQEFQGLLAEREPLAHGRAPEELIDPSDLIPFYQSFGLDSFQCFYADWYPQQEMGNLYYSGIDHSLSEYGDSSKLSENLAFPTFLDWLLFYIQARID